MSTPSLRFGGAAALAAVLLVGCAEKPRVSTISPAPSQQQAPLPSGVAFQPVGFGALPGWQADAVNQALPAFARSCAALTRKAPDAPVGSGPLARPARDWQRACAQIPASATSDELRGILARTFTPYRVTFGDGTPTGLFTGYYEAELNGSLIRTARYAYPVHGRPVDLVEREEGGRKIAGRIRNGKLEPYPTRAEIEAGALGTLAPVLFWVDSAVDLHIAQIQGSSQVRLADGRIFRIGYGGSNGYTFKGLGRILLDHGLVQPGQATMPDIRAFLLANPNQAPGLMRENPRYIFFRPIEGDGPVGAMGVPLTPGRSLAVDPTVVPLGAPVWLDTITPDGLPLVRLMAAQDVGSAIKGAVRGDFFWGAGEPALAQAGRMKSPGRYFVLIPNGGTSPRP